MGPRNATGIVVATAGVALGFALLENVNVVVGQAHWERIAITRSLFAVPMHTLVGVYLGRGIARAWRRTGIDRAARLTSTLATAALLHGLYDFPLLAGAHAPLVPTPVAQIAANFSMQPSELLGWLLTAAIAALCLAALRSASTDRPGAGARRPAPSWTVRLVDASAVGLGAGATALCLLALEGRAIGVDALLTLACVDAALMLVGVAGVAWSGSGTPSRTANLTAAPFTTGLLFVLGVLMAFDPGRRSLLAEMLVETGRIAAGQADLQRAQSALTDALAHVRSNATLLLRAEVETMRHRYAEALADLDGTIAAGGGDADLFVRRAQMKGFVHDGAGALADADHAVALAPRSTAPLVARSIVHLELDDAAAAGADVAAASALAQKGDVPVLLARAEVARAEGDGATARAALDRAIHDAPGSADAWAARGRLRFDQGDPKGAAEELAHAAALGSDPYTLLWLYLARSRTGGGAAREFAALSTRIDHRDWPGPLLDLFLGTATARSAMAAPRDADQRCEASFYVGEWLIAQGLGEVAPGVLAGAAKACPPGFFERRGAIAELARIQAAEATRHPSRPAAAPASQDAPAAPPRVAAAATVTMGATATDTAATKATATLPTATATLEGDRCDAAGTATWRSVPADAARLLPPSLSVVASLPRSATDFRLEFRPGDFKDPASAIQVLIGVPQMPGVAAIRSVTDLGIEGSSGSRAVRLAASPVNTVGGLFIASEDRADARADLGALGRGDALVVRFLMRSQRPCTLRVTADAAAVAAIRSTVAAW